MRKSGALLTVAAFCLTLIFLSQASADTSVQGSAASQPDPASTAKRWPKLSEAADPDLQHLLDVEINILGLRNAAERNRFAVALVDVSDPNRPRYAAVNSQLSMYAASLPKIAILLGVFQKAHDAGVEVDAATMTLCRKMIQRSSNPAATKLLKSIGFEYLANLLRSKKYELYDEETGGGLWVGKAYASSSAWRRDPLNNLSHGASVYQVARFYYLLETGRLVSPQASNTMKELLADSKITHKFVRGLKKRKPKSVIYRKSGTWREWHADGAIVERDGKRYIAVGLIRDTRGDSKLSQLIVALDNLIFEPGKAAN